MFAKKLEKNLLVALDIGTSKIVALIGTMTPANKLEVVGIGTYPSIGLRRGVVVNIESTVHSIQQAIQQAERKAGQKIHYAFTGIAGSHIKSMNSHGIVAIRNQEVCPEDVERVIDAAKAVAIPADQRILHILPQEFIIDQQDGIHDPIGMSGVRLEAKVHMITGAVSAAQNIAKCVQRCGLEIGDIILEQIASSQSVLSSDEKQLGVCLIDIGAGTTDIAIFIHGAVRYTMSLPVAGDQVTNDLAIALRTSTQIAEEIKQNYAHAISTQVHSGETINVPLVSEEEENRIGVKLIAEVVEARYEELFQMIRTEIARSGLQHLISAGIVLTGGGSKVSGVADLAEAILDMPVRLGTPRQYMTGQWTEQLSDPIYATGVGLLLYGHQQQQEQPFQHHQMNWGIKSVWRKMTGWFQGHF